MLEPLEVGMFRCLARRETVGGEQWIKNSAEYVHNVGGPRLNSSSMRTGENITETIGLEVVNILKDPSLATTQDQIQWQADTY